MEVQHTTQTDRQTDRTLNTHTQHTHLKINKQAKRERNKSHVSNFSSHFSIIKAVDLQINFVSQILDAIEAPVRSNYYKS